MEQLCVSVSEADTTSVSVLQEWKKRMGEDKIEEEREDTEEQKEKGKFKEFEANEEKEESCAFATSASRKRLISDSPPSSPITSPAIASVYYRNPAPFLAADANPPIYPSLSTIDRMNRTFKPRGEKAGSILPAEILQKVFRFIPWLELLRNVALVSRDWLALTRADNLWRAIYAQTWGTFYDNSRHLHGTKFQKISFHASYFFLLTYDAQSDRLGSKDSFTPGW
jgi:hypothetical protein